MTRYDTSQLLEDQYEPGSSGAVLRNLRGLVDRDEMELAETAELWRVQESLLSEVTQDQQFTAQDLCMIHRNWLGGIYEWAGTYRRVNISKDGFPFAMAHTIDSLMGEFEKQQLATYTPCLFDGREEVTHALAEVHVELMLIHPFREGNGRLGRILATLMALQAGLPPLDFSAIAGEGREAYFAAVRAGIDRNYNLMKGVFSRVIERTLRSK